MFTRGPGVCAAGHIVVAFICEIAFAIACDCAYRMIYNFEDGFNCASNCVYGFEFSGVLNYGLSGGLCRDSS